MAHALTSKTVVITGASSGIGRAAALEMARRGARLVIAARRAERLEEVASACRALGAECRPVVTDVTSRQDCLELIRVAGSVDVLVNNAGFAILDRIEEADPVALERMMQTNYFGAVHCTQAVLPQMISRRSGTIVNVSSIMGVMAVAGMGGYCATKFALNGFTEALRDEVMGSGVRVALVCPATTETEFFDHAVRSKMPAASKLMPSLDPARVGRAICASAVDGRYRRILPASAGLFMRLKEISPRFAHLLMRRVSALLE